MKIGIEFLNNQEALINFFLKKPKAKFTTKDFHQLRLEIKKLNAFLDFINYCSKDFNLKKIFKPFYKIFRKAGKIRALQLEELTIRKHNINGKLKEYLTKLKLEIFKEKAEFFMVVNQLYPNKIRKKQKDITTYLTEINDLNRKEYLIKKSASIQKLISKKRLKRKKLHELRKQLKILNYNTKILLAENLVIKAISAENLSSLLGKWHDTEELIKKFKKGIENKKINYKERKELKKLKEITNSKKKKLFDKINAFITEYSF